ncbi:hypothetical protein OESDEN_06219 [Oesophagostomum dentatum]|uniref:Uncharacterized protein n=1 Tax=Oesophagostomum dentatum TaxID=61180 RepID=A0A0B1T9D9_OESDE|nr:hypothetical protein OESDEN_06219 [Oesophagostomum dentatum]
MDIRDIRRIGKAKWFSIMKAFPAKLMYKASFALVLLEVPLRFSCHIHEFFLAADNFVAAIAVILTTVHYLYYCRAIPFVGPFVLMVYTIIATDLTRFFLIYSIFLVGFSQCELRRISDTILSFYKTSICSTCKAFTAILMYKASFALVLLEVPLRFSCHIHEFFLAADNFVAAIAVILTTVHYLYYCRAIPFVGPFVLMVYTIIATDLTRFFLIYSIFLVGFSQCELRNFSQCCFTLLHQHELVRVRRNKNQLSAIDASKKKL